MSQAIVLAGTADFATREDRDACLTGRARYQAQARSDEPGCLAYYFAPDPVKETRMVVWELRADSESLSAYFLQKHYLDTRAHLGRHRIVRVDFKKSRVDHTEPVYDGDGKPRGDFFMLKS